MWQDKTSSFVICALLVFFLATDVPALEYGAGRASALLDGKPITVFTYRPSSCRRPDLLFVFHGTARNAAGYRDHARPLANRLCLLVLAPLFDRERFPNWRYHRGGIVRNGHVLPSEQWTVTIVSALVTWARQREGRSDASYYLFGHSAGGQFLSRVAAFAPPADAARIIVANPSSYVMPSLEEPAPYGLGRAFEGTEAEVRLKAYLALPMTIYLGAADTGQKRLLSNAAARRQGANRLERGRHVYGAALALSRQRRWPFNWKLVTVPGVGHSARRMLAAPQAIAAFGFPPAKNNRLP